MKNDGGPRVVVITGASSGIGRATAHAFAKQGARLVLAARNAPSLEETAREVRARGGDAVVVPTDICDGEQVRALVQAAVDTFGRIDVWVGSAAVYSYGTFERTPPEVFRKVVETNLLGQADCVRAVLPVFRRQGGGVLILLGSIASKIPLPFIAPYAGSKFALLALAEVLREELDPADGISVCTVLPASFDTPIHHQAANYTGRRIHPLPPVSDPRRVARAVVRLADRPRRVVMIGRTQGAFVLFRALAPRLFERSMRRLVPMIALRRGAVPATTGNVYGSRPQIHGVTGGWRSGVKRALGLGAAAAAVAAAARRR